MKKGVLLSCSCTRGRESGQGERAPGAAPERGVVGISSFGPTSSMLWACSDHAYELYVPFFPYSGALVPYRLEEGDMVMGIWCVKEASLQPIPLPGVLRASAPTVHLTRQRRRAGS